MNSKVAVFLVLIVLQSLSALAHNVSIDYERADIVALINELDKTAEKRSEYQKAKQNRITKLKADIQGLTDLEAKYIKCQELYAEYESFISDSAEIVLQESLILADKMKNERYRIETELRLAMLYSMSGMFVMADEIFDRYDYDNLESSLRGVYCYARIRYCENVIRSFDDDRITERFNSEIKICREELLKIWTVGSVPYMKEQAFLMVHDGKYKEACEILRKYYEVEQIGTHGYAMMAMGLADCYQRMGNIEKEKRYLIIAAITDIKLAIKENEALLALSDIIFKEGDVERAYKYVTICLEDASFYNSKFKDSVIVRTYSVVDNTYLKRLEDHREQLEVLIGIISVLVLILSIVLYWSYRQRKAVSAARAELKSHNDDLILLNMKLDEANLIKERYVGYFMNQCSVYVNKLDAFRKNVKRKITAGQIDDLYVMSSRPLEKEIEELYANFDRVFLNLYPDFVQQFNALLKPEARFDLEPGKLNISLRIYALMLMGITNMGDISKFLNYSLQTVYNYRSKVKKDSYLDSDEFDEAVKKIGNLHRG